jgi:hypothetical protein
MNEEELTEDQIIKNGLKNTTKTDIICYIGMGICFLMIFVPPIFKKVFYDPGLEWIEAEIVYTTLDCMGNVSKGDYLLYTTTKSNYINSRIRTVELTYTYKKFEGKEDVEIKEIQTFLGITAEGLKSEKVEDGYKFTIDYNKNKSLMQNEVLREFAYAPPTQLNKLQSQKLFCNMASETKVEEMYQYEYDERYGE